MRYRFGDCELDDRRYELRRDGVPCHLEPQVYEVLVYLVRNRDRVVTRNELLDEIWGSRFVTDSALASRVKAARRAVGDNGRDQRMIRTVHGRGYRFLAPVREQDQEPAPALTPAAPATAQAPPVPAPAAPVLGPAAGPSPVGRAAELERLAALHDLAARGQRQVVFVTGEAGIGKTTLVEAFARSLGRDRPGLVARGQCLEHRGAPEAYLPVFDALARLCRQDGQGVLALLSAIAPTWLVQMPGLAGAGDRELLERRALGGTRERMLREAAEALEAIGADRPLVLLLEDLHWADPSTVDLVAWLATRDTAARLLLIGTYRPADALAAGHPIGDAGTDLRLRGRVHELALGELDPPAVHQVLQRQLPGAEVPEELARSVHRRTDGVPLFVGQLAQAWRDAGVLRPAAGGWELARRPDGGEPAFPDDLRRLIELQLERLDAPDLTILEAAAVTGVEFAAAAAAAGGSGTVEEVEGRCAALARQHRFLRATGPVDWPDGTVSAGFAFAHDLHRTVLYDRIPAARRARMHAAVAARLERASGPAPANVTELANQFLLGRDDGKAVHYLQAAAEQALRRSAYREAIEHLEALLGAVERLPRGPDRDQAELLARMALGPALIATRGFASPEVEATYERARELAEGLDRPYELSLVLHGLAAVQEFRGRYHRSQALLEELLRTGGAGVVVEAHELLACSTFHQGAAVRSVRHAEQGLALFEAGRDIWYLAPYGEHPAVSCHDWAGLALWFLGRPDSALAHVEQALAMAREYPYSLASAEIQLSYLHRYRGEPEAALRWANRGAATATEHGFPIRTVQGAILGGWALAATGAAEEGAAQLRAGLAGYLATGAELDHPYYTTWACWPTASATPAGRPRAWPCSTRRSPWSGPPGRSTTCPSCTGSAATCWPGTAGATPRRPRPTAGPSRSRPATAPGPPSSGRPSGCAACPPARGRGTPGPACRGCTTSSRRASTPPTCARPGSCSTGASPPRRRRCRPAASAGRCGSGGRWWGRPGGRRAGAAGGTGPRAGRRRSPRPAGCGPPGRSGGVAPGRRRSPGSRSAGPGRPPRPAPPPRRRGAAARR
jgi:DNA-binding winged helix-turn-helix (wHTH) protein/tetratricopeptide (TPR) repeat protein